MAKINLSKGEGKGVKIDLKKEAPGSKRFRLDLSWDASFGGVAVDLDVMAILTNKEGKILNDNIDNIVFFNNAKKSSVCGGVTMSEDNRTGEGSGVDEWVEIDFDKVDKDVDKIDLAITLYDPKPGVTFATVEEAKCVINDLDQGSELLEYYLDDLGNTTSVIMAQFVKRGENFQFKILEATSENGFEEVLGRYGIEC